MTGPIRSRSQSRTAVVLLSVLASPAILACDGPTSPGPGGGDGPSDDDRIPSISASSCVVDISLLEVDAEWDAIRSIDDPVFVAADDDPVDFLGDDSRVMGFERGEDVFAVPLNLLFSHEVLNLDGEPPLVVTYCPLTGSSMAFVPPEGAESAGVSGLLLHNNLVFFDRSESPSIWSQMGGRAICGVRAGTRLGHWPVVEMRWAYWRKLHPETLVLAPPEGAGAIAGSGTGAAVGAADSGETVLGVPSPLRDRPVQPGMAFPVSDLRVLDGERQVFGFTLGGEARVLLWSDEADGGMAYELVTEGGRVVDIQAGDAADGKVGGFVDRETGSRFTLDGRAVSGPLVADRLVPVSDTYVAFRVPWRSFHPDSRIWGE